MLDLIIDTRAAVRRFVGLAVLSFAATLLERALAHRAEVPPWN
jgi:hypothetical protein